MPTRLTFLMILVAAGATSSDNHRTTRLQPELGPPAYEPEPILLAPLR